MKIGHVIRRLRHRRKMTLQQLSDATGGTMQVGYISRVERDEMSPSVYAAAEIARALSTTVDALISEANAAAEEQQWAPVETRRLVPLLKPEAVLAYLSRQPGDELPTPDAWIMPLEAPEQRTFAFSVPDQAMNSRSPQSISWGSQVIVQPDLESTIFDTVLLMTPEGGLVIRRIYNDGRSMRAQAENDAYPSWVIDEGWRILGVVIASVQVIKGHPVTEMKKQFYL